MNEITDQLWIGSIDDVRECPTEQFDHIVTVCQEHVGDNVSEDTLYDWFNMADGPSNIFGGRHDYDIFEDAADVVHYSLERGLTVLVHCHHGQSRSTSVATAALAKYENFSYYEALSLVKVKRPETHPDPLLRSHARKYVIENVGVTA